MEPSSAFKLGIRPLHSGVVNLFLQSRDVQSVTWVSHLTQAGSFCNDLYRVLRALGSYAAMCVGSISVMHTDVRVVGLG